MMTWTFNDGGRKQSGFKGEAGDCGVRAVAIATDKPYLEVYNRLNEFGSSEHITKKKKGKSNARTGIYKQTMQKYMQELGWSWHPTMFIGSGCKVHLKAEELPKGNIICNVSKHYVAVIDGIIQDTHDCSRDGTRCVYGYWINPQVKA